MAPSVRHVSGHVTGEVEVRFTDSGVAVSRFRLTETPTHWDPTTQKWREGAQIRYICTAWRELARHTGESLTDGVDVLIKGRITDVRDNAIYLSVDDIGISLRQRIAYTESSLPSPSAARPMPVPCAASGVPRTATRQADAPPAWWQVQTPSD